ncbi:MAG: pyruvate, phosphate dikinase [Mycobacteriales bacterium]
MSVDQITESVVVLDGTSGLSRQELGGKAWGINAMRRLGLPVPPAFTLPTSLCREFMATGCLPSTLAADLRAGLDHLERETGRRFGASGRPLLVSVRSGAAASMPGMMDTVLNLGCTSAAERALAQESGNAAWAAEVRARFLAQYRTIVVNADATVPDDPFEQLHGAVEAVLRSWRSPRALAYRAHRGLGEDGGTAVTVQAMVFGNVDDRSGTGVLFSRNPLTGARIPYGEWLPGGQGDDVVSGTCTPLPLAALAAAQSEVHQQLLSIAEELEHQARDVQDIEFTVESGRLWILQTRNAKRSPRAAVHAAVSMVAEGLISEREAVGRVRPEQVRSLLAAQLDDSTRAVAVLLAKGEPACPGSASGVVVIDTDEAERLADAGTDVVLARTTTAPEDVAGMFASVAVITEQGGATSHAALVSREIGVPCVVGAGVDTLMVLAGETVTVDGGTGEIFAGRLVGAPIKEQDDADLGALVDWAQRATNVRVHADSASLEGQAPMVTDAAQLETVARRARAVTLCDPLLHDPAAAGLLIASSVTDVVAVPRLPLLLSLVSS